jgi:nicotinamidase-related amidase
MFRSRQLLPAAAIAAIFAYTASASAETIIDEWTNVKAPPAPALQSATADPKTTAIIVIDMIKQTCNEQRRPRCVASVPKVEKLLAAARASGATVIYTLFPSPAPDKFPNPVIGDVLPGVAPKGNEPVVISFVDKFILRDKDTGFQKLLTDKGIKTIIPVGTASHNGLLFTAVDAALRGFNVIVPVDGMSGNNSYEDQLAAYTLTSSIVYKVTLTTTDMIKFQ